MTSYQSLWSTTEQQHGHESSDCACGGDDGAVETTSLGATSTTTSTAGAQTSPLASWIDNSGWTRQDVELALEVANLAVLALLVYAKYTEEN